MGKAAKRIETQIHRRRKAKALSPLQVEWDVSKPEAPAQLRMSSSQSESSRPKEKK